MRRLFGVSGTPGTGKKTVAPLVASALGVEAVSVNDLVRLWGLEDASGGVDTALVKNRIRLEVKGGPLLFGHLVPYVLPRSETSRVAVLRCEPTVLKKRLVRRGYPPAQVRENVEAELIGEISADSWSAFGDRSSDFDSTDERPARIATKVVEFFIRGDGGRSIEWAGNYDSSTKLSSLLR